MNRKKLLYTAAFFTLFTFVGHSVGTLLPRPPKTEAIRQAQVVMENTMAEFPMGSPRSLATLAYGGNAVGSLYLLVSGILFILLVREGSKKILLLNGASLAVCAVVSIIFYFPLPAICTGVAAILGFLASHKKN